jgi:hypothetical protein
MEVPLGGLISITWTPARTYGFHESHLKHLVSLKRSRNVNRVPDVEIRIREDRDFFDALAADVHNDSWLTKAQHRGRNPAEHKDLSEAKVGNLRLVKLPTGNAVALVDDDALSIDLHCEDESHTNHELRRIVRDEIAVPMLVTSGAHIFHAGICRFEGLNVFFVGPSGGGKTTLALALMADGSKSSGYGAAERTAVWLDRGELMALGIPESLTVFPGTLASIPSFSDKVLSVPESTYWLREHKIRLQQEEIVQRSGSKLLQGAVSVDIILELIFDPESEDVRKFGAITVPAETEQIMRAHDLTFDDAVRLPWLNWFKRVPRNDFYRDLSECRELPGVFRVSWSDARALKDCVIGLVARKTLSRARERTLE